MKHPLIIIEGQDRCSKSTLTKQLSVRYGPGVLVHHSSGPPKLDTWQQMLEWEKFEYRQLFNTFQQEVDTVWGYNQFFGKRGKIPIIADRFHLGVPVYGKRYRNYPANIHCTDIERFFPGSLYNVYLIVLTDYHMSIMSRNDYNSLEHNETEIEQTKQEFIKEFAFSSIPNKLLLNISDIGGFNNILPKVIEFYEGREHGYS